MFYEIKKIIVFIKNIFLHLLLSFGYIFNFPLCSALAIKLSLFKSKAFNFKKKKKNTLIISYRTGGVDDIYQVFKNKPSNRKILFLDRKYLRKIFLYFHKDKKITHEKEFIFRSKYREFMKNLVFWLDFFEKDFLFLTFNFNYFEDAIFREFAFKNGNICFLHFKESFRTKAEFKIHNDKSLHRYLKYFTRISVYNHDTKKHFAKRLKNLSNKISVVGCPRALFSFNLMKNIKKTKISNILFYYFKKNKGMPVRNNKFNYFNETKIKKHKPISWEPIINQIFDTMIKLSKVYPHINFFIKAKKGESENIRYINKIKKMNLPNLRYFNEGPGHHFLVNSQIIIGMNSAAILESLLAGKKVLIPHFSSFRKKIYNQYTFDLPKNLMVENRFHLEKILESNIKKGYINLPIKIKSYNKISKKYFGDFINSKKNLRKFLKC